MKKWNELFTRHGWLLTEKEDTVFDCTMETEMNLRFLEESLEKAAVSYTLNGGLLFLPTATYSEEKWLDAVSFNGRGRGEGLWFNPETDQPKVRELDTYICGVVRQLHRLGFQTIGSCDGHGKRLAHVLLKKDEKIEVLQELLLALGLKRMISRENRTNVNLSLHVSQRELLDLAEKLSIVDESWLKEGYEFFKEQLFYQLTEQLLSIPGVSGEENLVREFVMEKLKPYVDFLTVDHAGNILAEKTYRGGNGPTILLNAHLDTVFEFEDGREIIKNGTEWTSSAGILGADDRAGVAVLLQTAKTLDQSTFSGKVKFIFTVEEECGLVGASKVHDYFLWGTDAAIVVDRRGTGDIVTSCGSYIPFCKPEYGKFFEEVASENGLIGWATTPGGSSDTRIWAEHGIQSVNLSAGYFNEHTSQEMLDVKACYQTAKLIEAVFENSRRLRRTLHSIKTGARIGGGKRMLRKVIVIDDEENTLEEAIKEKKNAEAKGHQVAFDLTKIKDSKRKTEIIMKTKSKGR